MAILTFILPSSFARAEAGDDKGLPTAYFMGDVSYSVSRSDVIVGTDFGAANNYEMGSWAGKSKNIGFSIRHNTLNIDYTQVDGQTITTWTDFLISYR